MDEKQVSRDERPARDDDHLSPADKRRLAEQIGRQLRGMYDGLLNQPVPDRLTDLVRQLESRAAHGKTDGD